MREKRIVERKVKMTFIAKLKRLSIQKLKPSLNVYVSSEKLLLYHLMLLIMSGQVNVVLLQIIFVSLGSRPLINIYDI